MTCLLLPYCHYPSGKGRKFKKNWKTTYIYINLNITKWSQYHRNENNYYIMNNYYFDYKFTETKIIIITSWISNLITNDDRWFYYFYYQQHMGLYIGKYIVICILLFNGMLPNSEICDFTTSTLFWITFSDLKKLSFFKHLWLAAACSACCNNYAIITNDGT